ncbi:DNA-directed RNA polymerase I subunit rpa49-like [Portunus trituberculatus]|uniref:DNA-directed RNA polymerase I subunit RPA49 n=1 Tax=Portunus trituberculatus TaxID=210409 RepID=A0A5B7DVA7_PORTR|nr:DNA-directed RNA polymerase I subunit rpa49-like [Portunus trituberculatus]MPC25388.1 DNA-directed RNA polymerase I subunit RPA49 [Portunus trituberculatus]
MGYEEDADKRPRLKKKKYMIEDVVMKKKNKIEPLLVSFANGQPLEGSELIGTLHRSSDKQEQRSVGNMLTFQTPFLNYAGRLTNAKVSGGVTTFLGVLDPGTGRMRLVETSQYTVQPLVKDTVLCKPIKAILDAKTYDEKQEVTASAFGSKKAKQAMNRKQQNKVEAETMEGAIDQAAATIIDSNFNVEDYLEQQQDTSLLSILPPCNRKANQIQDVYKLETLAPDDFLAQLQESAEALLSGQELEHNSTLLFREMVENAQHEAKYANQLRLACLALLVSHLITFVNLRDPMLRKFMNGKVMENSCSGVVNWIMQEYTVKQGNFISRTKKDGDRALCLTLILAFISSKYELSVSTLLQSVPVNKERLNLLMRVIGATYSSATHSFVLKLPLAKCSQPAKKSKDKKHRRL